MTVVKGIFIFPDKNGKYAISHQIRSEGGGHFATTAHTFSHRRNALLRACQVREVNLMVGGLQTKQITAIDANY